MKIAEMDPIDIVSTYPQYFEILKSLDVLGKRKNSNGVEEITIKKQECKKSCSSEKGEKHTYFSFNYHIFWDNLQKFGTIERAIEELKVAQLLGYTFKSGNFYKLIEKNEFNRI